MTNRTEHSLPAGFPPLTIEVQPGRVSQAGLLELMRLGAGLNYKELAAAAHLPASRVERILGAMHAQSREKEIPALLRVLWDRLPLRPSPRLVAGTDAEPEFLTRFQVAKLLAVTPNAVQAAAHRNPELGALRKRGRLLFRRASIIAHVASRCGFIPTGPEDWLTVSQTADLLGATCRIIRYAIAKGTLPAFRLHSRSRYQIPRCLAVEWGRRP